MKDLSAGVILYIEPSGSISAEPVIDQLTRQMAAALRQAPTPRFGTKGWHTCQCGVDSTNYDYQLAGGKQTNSLAVHYLAWHRDEVPQSELEKVAALTSGEVEPTEAELARPQTRS